MNYTVILMHLVSGSGYRNSETFDHINKPGGYTAENYVNDFDGDPISLIASGCDAVNVELHDDYDNIQSEYFLTKEV